MRAEYAPREHDFTAAPGRPRSGIYNGALPFLPIIPPMRILLVKTSSLGDVIHNLPVVSDIRRHFPNATVDWCVDASFADIPRLHPGVSQVIPVALRHWRKQVFRWATWREILAFRRRLRSAEYDFVIDTQGLLKSALITGQARGLTCGYAADSAREPVAARYYAQRFSVSRAAHAVSRNRQLAAAVLGYALDPEPDYGIAAGSTATPWLPDGPYAVMLTATSRDDKLWPEDHWLALARALHARGLRTLWPGGSAIERARVERLTGPMSDALVVPPLGLPALAAVLAGARLVVGVDTGLSHLAVALNTPTVALYTATEPGLTGVFGRGFHRNLGGKAQCPGVAEVLTALQPVLG
jgi:heptosyltransferase I